MFCLVKVFCGGDGLGLYDFIISYVAVHTVSMLQKLMPCNVDRSLFDCSAILAVGFEMRFSGTETFDVGKVR